MNLTKHWGWQEWVVLAGIVVLLILPPVCWVFSAYMEAKAYNRVTGAHVTTWDAMWVELRVQEHPK